MTLRQLKEWERYAYITGNVELAKALAMLIDRTYERAYHDQ